MNTTISLTELQESEFDSDTIIQEVEKSKPARYGIAEWYGIDVAKMSAEQRSTAAQTALVRGTAKPTCPFMATLDPKAKCNKNGGVCTIRRYETINGKVTIPIENNTIVTVCPSRFLGKDAAGKPVLEWVAEKMLDSKSAIIVKETPFLRKLLRQRSSLAAQLALKLSSLDEEDDPTDKEETKKAGRIDWLLVDGKTAKDSDPKWCALETQAVYFSGDNMSLEFQAYADNPEKILYPVGFRRPDYRSSGPKRLAPQLSVKVPVLRGWGKKVAVLVDKYFYDCMYDLPEAFQKGRTDSAKRDNSEVAWFVVDFDKDMKLTLEEYKFSTLDGSIDSLNATAPMSKEDFTKELKQLFLDTKKIGKKIFTQSY